MIPDFALFVATGGGPSGLIQFLPLILIGAIFYFLLIAPERRRRKQLQATVEALKKGDRVVTQGGVFGDVVSTEPTTVILQIADGVRVKVTKSSITGLAEETQS
ncbi:MAG: preprotein translocase subunit YajC [Acidobacteriota bacterium]|jgi:preprotein translocase subunit YajC|nr:preprotein translocase subunit YajC [Acidobacteriota bacterium]